MIAADPDVVSGVELSAALAHYYGPCVDELSVTALRSQELE